jgi:Tfp pilus assembly protein PilX
MKKLNKIKDGAVSLFVVVFATLLITVVTVGFVRIMVIGQQEATSADLSQSAYDSAQAGVEDAKRAIAKYYDCKSGKSIEGCDDIDNIINSKTCNEAMKTLGVAQETNEEVLIDSIASQAYSCVKISLNTPDYLGVLAKDESKIIPLRTEGIFNKIQIQWFTSEDAGIVSNLVLPIYCLSAFQPFYATWKQTTPSVMRAQIVQTSESFSLSDFDRGSSENGGISSSLLFYPIEGTNNVSEASFETDSPRPLVKSPTRVVCLKNILAGGYACKVNISLSRPEEGTAYLRLTSFYNTTHYSVSLYNGSSLTKFKAVQPEVDSTGRASSLFRRVSARVEIASEDFIYPNAAVETNNFCKNFFVATDYYSSNCKIE